MNNPTRKKTPEEISAIRKAASLKRKTFAAGPGRPKGTRNAATAANGCTIDEPRAVINVLKKSREVLAICAKIDGVSTPIFVKRLTDQLKTHPRYAAAFQGNQNNKETPSSD